MKTIGLTLIIIGIAGLIYSGINYTTQEKVVDIGPLKIEKNKKHRIDWPPIAGVLVLIAGVALVVLDKKKIS